MVVFGDDFKNHFELRGQYAHIFRHICLIFTQFKGTVSVISSDPQFKHGNALHTTAEPIGLTFFVDTHGWPGGVLG